MSIYKTNLFIALLLFAGGAFGAAALENELKDHPAPYLALHGDDPVAWQEWQEDTVARAAKEGKILFLSVGYFACHWCHVMQRESYQNAAVAKVLNDGYISVKIDRELEPALDSRLMDFTQRTTGRGGWPMNIFITPDGHPIHSVMYVPQPQFLQLVTRLQEIWVGDRQRVLELVRAEVSGNFPDAKAELSSDPFAGLVDAAAETMMARADLLSGGWGEQNKFPSAPQLEFLLDDYERRPRAPVEEFLRTTLDAMQQLGLNDHLQGGFYRYTVDLNWTIPHFEKMLYDNANLALVYLRASEVLDEPAYRQTAIATLDFMIERMMHDGGAMVASFSAVDEQGVEGGNYLWEIDELERVLEPAELDLVVSVWGLNRPNELEAGNHLRYFTSLKKYARLREQPLAEAEQLFASAKRKMSIARDLRPLPVDDKLLAGWNGLALRTFAHAAQHEGLERYRETAKKLRDFLLTQVWDGERLSRARVKGKIYGSASLQDYGYVALGLLAWAELTGADADYRTAHQIAELGWSKFYKNNGWYLEDGSLLAPPSAREVMPDGANPSPAGLLMRTTLALAAKLGDSASRERTLAALNRGVENLRRAPFWYVSQLQAVKSALNK